MEVTDAKETSAMTTAISIINLTHNKKQVHYLTLSHVLHLYHLICHCNGYFPCHYPDHSPYRYHHLVHINTLAI